MHSWNLLEWMRALGLKRKEQPDLMHVVQPVEIVGDHSGFSSQLLPPMAWMGGGVGAVVAVYGGIRLVSRAPGGTYIRYLELYTGAGSHIQFEIVETGDTMANLVANMEVSDMGNTPTVSRMEFGTWAALPALGTVAPRFQALASGHVMYDVAYVPPGYTFQLWNITANVLLRGCMMFEDCPAQLAAR
jgi:hypothetical protein